MRDCKHKYSEQYRSLLLTFLSLIVGNRSFEIFLSRGFHLRRKYLNRLRTGVKVSDVIIFEGPWQYPLVSDLLAGKMVIYDAHNVEYLLRNGNKYQDECRKIESSLLDRADLVFSVTKKDIANFIEIYNVDESKIHFVPLLVQAGSGEWKGKDSNRIVFIGSVYSPNNSAVENILDIAKRTPQFSYEIIGSVRPARRLRLKNVKYHGLVDEYTKDRIMENCFLALNPVTEGSGRNVKMLDYLAHGLPILSTKVGARGLEEFDISSSIVVRDLEDFASNIVALANDRKRLEKMSTASRNLYDQIMKIEGTVSPDEIINNKYETMRAKQLQL